MFIDFDDAAKEPAGSRPCFSAPPPERSVDFAKSPGTREEGGASRDFPPARAASAIETLEMARFAADVETSRWKLGET